MNEKRNFENVLSSLIESDEKIAEHAKNIKEEEITSSHKAKLVIRNTKMFSQAMRRNIELAERSDTDPVSVNNRVNKLVFLAIFGGILLFLFLFTLLTKEFSNQSVEKLIILIAFGSFGVFICASLGAVYVSWNAFMQKSFLEKRVNHINSEITSLIRYSREKDRNRPIESLFDNEIIKAHCS